MYGVKVVWTWLVTAYLILTPLLLPVAYNMWAHLVLEVLSWLFWLSGFASAASWASTWASNFSGTGVDKKVFSYWATAAACAGLGAIMWYVSHSPAECAFASENRKQNSDFVPF